MQLEEFTSRLLGVDINDDNFPDITKALMDPAVIASFLSVVGMLLLDVYVSRSE
jgi:hypothetical protein